MALNSPAVDIVDFLEAAGFGTKGVNLFSFGWGTGGDVDINSQVMIAALDGLPQEDRTLVEQPTIQVLTRGEPDVGSVVAYARARGIHEFLIQDHQFTINGTEYIDFEPLSLPQTVGRDSESRQIISATYVTMRNPQSAQ
jgi:hypothetical protein